MRCTKCKSLMSFLVTSIQGETFRQCHTQLTRRDPWGRYTFSFQPCGTVHDGAGKEFQGSIAYRSGGKIHIITVQAGGRVVR